jgi:TRAP-type C4-dicarboxylate transport system permease large subunit
VTTEAVSKSIMVFYIPMIIVPLLMTYVPALSLWLPGLFK